MSQLAHIHEDVVYAKPHLVALLLTHENIAMQSCVLGWPSTNVLAPDLSLGHTIPGDVYHHPVTPLAKLGVRTAGSIWI